MLLIGNLDAEVELSGRRHETLPPRVLRGISALAGLMSALGQDGDALWTPAAVDPARWVWPTGRGGLARVVPVVGNLVDAAGNTDDRAALAWCQTRSVTSVFGGSDPAVVARVNHRRFGHELEVQMGVAPATAHLVSSVDEVERAAAGWPGDRSWIVKAPMSAAGRLRLRRRGPTLDDPARARVRRLLDRFGELLFEPWLERVRDLGCCGRVAEAGDIDIDLPHAIHADEVGIVRGIDIGPAVVESQTRDALVQTARATGTALHNQGYRGPFGIDAFEYVDDRGQRQLRPLVEINARHTFGSIAAAVARRIAPGAPCRLVLATADPRHAVEPRPDRRRIELVAPSPTDGTQAWLELEPVASDATAASGARRAITAT